MTTVWPLLKNGRLKNVHMLEMQNIHIIPTLLLFM